MTVIVLNNANSDVNILDVEDEEELWEYYEEKDCTWMELFNVATVAAALAAYLHEECI